MKGEIIGEEIEVTKAENKSLLGLRGRVIDETKNTLVVKTVNGKKTIIKNQVEILIKSENVKVNGKEMAKRPEERIK